MSRNACICLFLLLLSFTACVDEELPRGNTRMDNFEALWQLMDERYCFFDYKKQTIGVDWDEVHTRYSRQVREGMTDRQLFEVLCNMLGELRDGHVNLGTAFDLGRNWSYYEEFPENYDADIVESYLGKGYDYGISASLRYRILDDNIGYVRCSSFNAGFGDGNLSHLLNELRACRGLIIDVRDNGGGQLTDAERLAARFTNQRTLVGYVCHKTGKGHSDFSDLKPIYIDPANTLRWQKPVVVLTNRQSYSATNDFVKCMRQFPLVTIMGDQTGGGAGMPFTQELPNGWSVRYSAVVYLDAERQHTEFGIQPDIQVSLEPADRARNIDTMIEAARQFLGSSR